MSKKSINTTPSEGRKWFVATLFALTGVTIFTLYVYLLLGSLGSLSAWNMITAGVAGILLASSLSASSLYYYLGWPNMKWGYQKQLGVLAFWMCFFYCVQLLLIEPEIYWYGFWDNLGTPNFIFGLSAMVIFGAMTFANTPFMRRFISWETVKFILGLGFFGYALLVVRAIFLEWHIWETWFKTLEGLPTTRFVLSVLAIAVLLLRASIILHSRLRK